MFVESGQSGGGSFGSQYLLIREINKETFQIDYLAYNYLTDGGGTRFRKAQNKRNIEGFWFQDYLNFKPLLPFPALDSLPIYFEQGKLQKVSQIENKNITVSFP